MLAESPNACGTSIAGYCGLRLPFPMPLDPSTLCARTAAGDAELAAPRHGLAIAQRRLLSLLDRPMPLDELAGRPGVLPDRLEKDLGRLSEHGLVALHGPAEPSIGRVKPAPARPVPPPPHQDSPRPWLPAQPGLSASMSPPAPESRVILGKRVRHGRAILLGFLTLCGLGAAVWWFSAPPREPAMPAAPAPRAASSAPASTPTADRAVARPDEPALPIPAARDIARPADPVATPRATDVMPRATGVVPPAPVEAPAALRSAAQRPTTPTVSPVAQRAEPPAPTPTLVRTASPEPPSAAIASARPGPAIGIELERAPSMAAALPPPAAPAPAVAPPPLPAAPIPASESAAAARPAPSAPPAPAPAAATHPPPSPVLVAAAARSTLPARTVAARLEPISREAPEFPRDALAQGIERGTVRARLSIDASGKVTDVEILDAEPRRVFDRAVRRALARWVYPSGDSTRTTVVEVAFHRD